MTRRFPKLCPPLTFKCEGAVTEKSGLECRAFRDGEEVGRIDLAQAQEGDEPIEGLLQVSMVRAFVDRPSEARCGVGTRLYEFAATEACRQGMRLSSDTNRTRHSEKFWKKQVEKGRAECVYKSKKGRRGADELDEHLGATGRRWRCRRYALKSCPSVIDLSGAQKRIDWRSEPLVRRRKK